jgi:hypothetical protein
MAIKKIESKKISDGLFVQDGPSLEIEDPSDAEIEEYFIKPFNTAMSIEHQLNVMETKIQKLLELPPEEDPKTTTDLGRKHKKYTDNFKHLEPIKGHAQNALLRLKIARESLEKRQIENAMVNTIHMMNAYWMGLMHEKIKNSIIRDNLFTPPKKRGGNMTGLNKKKAAQPEHDRIRALARPYLEKGKRISEVILALRKLKGADSIPMKDRQLRKVLEECQKNITIG